MTATVVLVALALGTYGLKAAGPMALGDRELPGALQRASQLLPAAMLAALVAVSTVTQDRHLTIDARLVGVAAAAIALWRRAPFVVVVAVAAGATGLTRLLAG